MSTGILSVIAATMNHNTLARFNAKFSICPDTGCWLWTASIHPEGYGRFWDGKVAKAHRVAHELFIGPIPDGLGIDHLCRVRHCVNPEHLEPVTWGENSRRGDCGKHMADRTHCPREHEYNATNTRVNEKGHRVCIECKRRINRECYHRKQVRP